MKVILREDVDGLGKQGDIVAVADGFARNHLVPKGLAFRSTPGAEKQAERTREIRRLQDVHDMEVAQEMADRISAATLAISARAGEGGKLFGSVTAADVALAISEQMNIELDRKVIALEHPIRDVGEHKVPLNLHEEVQPEITVEVIAEIA